MVLAKIFEFWSVISDVKMTRPHNQPIEVAPWLDTHLFKKFD